MEDFLNLDSFDSAAQQQQQQTQQPVLVAGQDDTNGMSFTELFQHYLAPEVAKLPNQYTSFPSTSAASHPFAPENDLSPASAASSFDPTAFLPTIPGSPIGGFSPSSDNSGQRYGASMSPLSFADLDGELQQGAGGNDWALDPSFFGGELPVVNEEPIASTSSATTLPAVLPPLPLGPIVNQEQPATILAPAPIASTSTASAPITRTHPKRHLSASVTGDDDEEDEEAFDSDASDASAATSSTKRRPSAPKKQKAASGKAKTPKTSVAAFATPTLHHTSSKSTLAPVPEWTDKPDPETYKKLNSKEKRQLRNKISARNFRHRRKEHLQTLEEEISSRDTIISQLRDEVGVMRTENLDLRGEVSMLKQKWDEMMEKMTSFAVPPAAVAAAGLGVNTKLAVAPVVKQEPTEEIWALDSPQAAAPEPLPTSAQASTSQPVPTARRAGTRGANGIAKPNLSKDVAPGMGRRTGSWTTAGGMGGGFTSVHTTLIPEFNLSNKPISSTPSSLFSGNFNPALNHLSAQQQAQLPSLTSHLRSAGGLTSPPAPSQDSSAHHPKGTFEDFFQTNPFWLRSDNVEEYRASLYGKLAHNAAGAQAAQKLQQANGAAPSPGQHLPLPQGFRPAFFSSSNSTSSPPPPYSPRRSPNSLDLNGKEEKTASDLLAFQSPSAAAATANQNNAYIATLATQTLFSRMTTAFVDAFAGAPEPSGAQRKLSGEKVASVLAGTSRLQVVPNAPAPLASPALEGLELSLGSLSIGGGESPLPRNLELGGGSGACSFEEMRRRWRGGRKTSHQGEETSS